MGQTESHQVLYSHQVSDKTENGSHIYRNPLTVDRQLSETCDPSIKTLQDAWLSSVLQHSDSICLGQRAKKDGKYQTRTYKEVNEICRELGSGVLNMELADTLQEYKDYKLQMVGVYSKNREEWLMVDIGCGYLYGMTVVPLYDTLGPDNITYCLNHSGMSVIFASKESVDTLMKTDDTGRLRTVIALDDITEEQKKKSQEKNIKIISFNDVREEGKKKLREYAKYDKNHIFTFSYTSGTTGNPKGAMLSHKNLTSLIAALQFNECLKMFSSDVYLSYLPLPHAFDRVMCVTMLYSGGAIYFYNGNPLKLKEDLADVKPTIFTSVPRLYSRFYDAILNSINSAGGLKTFLGTTAINQKLQNFQANCQYDHPVWDKLIFKKIREGIFGGRVRYMITGSAPLDKNVLDFLQIALSCPMYEGYGLTETTAASFLTHKDDKVSGHVGGVSANQEFKLVDIPDMNYTSTDLDQNGKQQPRGEVCMRGPAIFNGYYKDEQKTIEAIDSDGWFHSGDVGQIDITNGSLKIIDRKKNIFKLAQGEYIAPEKIEACYSKAEGVGEVFVYGDSLKAYLVGIVVPDQAILEKYSKEMLIEDTREILCENKNIKYKILQNMIAQGKKAKLFGFEQVKTIYLEPSSLQILGLVSSTMKLQRYKSKVHFKDTLDQLYQEPI